MDLRSFLYNKVGDVLTEPDYIWCIGQLDKMDKLAQDVAKLRSYVAKAAGIVTI